MTRMEDTARNLLYNGTLSMKKSVSGMKFLPQDKTMEKKVAPINAHFNGPFTMKHPSTNRNKTNAPT